jgi:hypothetical protein
MILNIMKLYEVSYLESGIKETVALIEVKRA